MRHPGARPADSLRSSTRDHRRDLRAGASLRAGAGRRAARPPPASRRCGGQLGHPDPGGDQPGVERGRVAAADQQPRRRRAARPGRRAGRAPAPGRGCRTTVAPVGARRSASSSCSTSRPRSSTPDPGAQLLDLGRAGGWTGRPSSRRGCRSSSSSRISWMPCGSRPLVGSSSTSSRGRRSSAAARPEPLAHAQRVGLHRPRVDAGQADLLQRRRRSGRRRVRRRAARARRRRAAPGSPGRTGARRRPGPRPARRPGAAPGGRPRGIGSPSSSTSPAVGSTSPSSIRTVVVLPEPLAPRKP